MGEFVFNDIIRSNKGEYFLKTGNSTYQNRIISSFFRNGTLIDSQYEAYDPSLSDEQLLNTTRRFHEEKKAEVQSLLGLAEKLKESDQATTKNILGLAFLRRGMFDEAINEFEEAIVLDPENSAIYNNLGKAYIGVDKIEDATRVLEQAVEISPNFADIHNNLGYAYLKQEFCKKAVEHFQKAVELNSYYAEAFYNLALALVLNAHKREDFNLSVNCYTKVMDNMEKAFRINPNYRNEHFERGEEFLRQKDYEQAYHEFEKGGRGVLKPNDLSFIIDFYLRIMHNDGKNLKSSIIWKHIRQLEEMLKKYPNYADLYNHLGVAYVIMSKYVNSKAMQQFNKALNINPDFEKAKRNKRLAEYDNKGIQLLFDAILK